MTLSKLDEGVKVRGVGADALKKTRKVARKAAKAVRRAWGTARRSVQAGYAAAKAEAAASSAPAKPAGKAEPAAAPPQAEPTPAVSTTASDALLADPAALAREFDRLKPWVNKFVINGAEYGGKIWDPNTDPRMPDFFKAFPNVETVLDLGCLEGAESFRIAAEHPTVKQVLGLEINPHNLEKANFIKGLIKADKVRFAHSNLELAPLTTHGRFDVVFCCGILYHLPEPWTLLEQIAMVTDNIFMWTHYSPLAEATVIKNGYRGLLYKEPWFWQDAATRDEAPGPESGHSPESFWPTRGDLQDMLRHYGFNTIRIMHEVPEPHPRPHLTLVASKH